MQSGQVLAAFFMPIFSLGRFAWRGILRVTFTRLRHGLPCAGHISSRWAAYRKGIIRHGDTVHHKVPITPENINDPEVTLNPDNLILLCRDCHALAHKKTKRYKVNDLGQVEAIE